MDAPFNTMVPTERLFAACCQAASRSLIRSAGPTNEISSINLSGTAAAASVFLPSR
jgi:hypothetical protein